MVGAKKHQAVIYANKQQYPYDITIRVIAFMTVIQSIAGIGWKSSQLICIIHVLIYWDGLVLIGLLKMSLWQNIKNESWQANILTAPQNIPAKLWFI